MNRISITCQEIAAPEWQTKVVRFCQKALKCMAVDGQEVSVLFTGDRFMAGLNRDYRGLDEPTDVLAFPQNEGPAPPCHGGPLLGGDVVVSLETASRQASERQISLEEEVRRLLVHGILHLEGRDHQNSEQRQAFYADQEKILKQAKEAL